MRFALLLIAGVLTLSAADKQTLPWGGIERAVKAGNFSDAIAIFEQQDGNVKQSCPAYALAFVVIAYDETNNPRAAIIALDGIRSAATSDRIKLSPRTIPMILGTLERHFFKEPTVRRRFQQIAADIRSH